MPNEGLMPLNGKLRAFARLPAQTSPEYSPQACSKRRNPLERSVVMMMRTTIAMNHCLCFLASLFYNLLNILDTPEKMKDSLDDFPYYHPDMTSYKV
jgi:hypothetical protein